MPPCSATTLGPVSRLDRLKYFAGENGEGDLLELEVAQVTGDESVVLAHAFDHQVAEPLADAEAELVKGIRGGYLADVLVA